MKWIKYSDKKPRINKLCLCYYNEGPEIVVAYKHKDPQEWPFRISSCGAYYGAPDYWIYIKDIPNPK